MFFVASPHPGALMSIGVLRGNGDYRRIGCFLYGAGESDCP